MSSHASPLQQEDCEQHNDDQKGVKAKLDPLTNLRTIENSPGTDKLTIVEPKRPVSFWLMLISIVQAEVGAERYCVLT